MEGPTPISALIHAATMVTAGVFMVARLFAVQPVAHRHDRRRLIGALTMMLGPTIAPNPDGHQTCGRLFDHEPAWVHGHGLRFGRLQRRHVSPAHPWCLQGASVLGCGSVIALHHEQDMRHMGGLKDKLLVTYWTFLVGSLALAGFPLTAGVLQQG